MVSQGHIEILDHHYHLVRPFTFLLYVFVGAYVYSI